MLAAFGQGAGIVLAKGGMMKTPIHWRGAAGTALSVVGVAVLTVFG